MYNWSTDKSSMKGDARAIWQLEQAINFGLNGRKISKKTLIRLWPELKLDKYKADFIKLFINEKQDINPKSNPFS